MRKSSCVCRTNSYDCRMNSYDSRATLARHSHHLSDMCPNPKSLLTSYVVRTAAIRIRKTAVAVRSADRKKKRHVEILLATLRYIVRRCEFVRQPYDLLRISCVSNRKRSQGCRTADVNKSLCTGSNVWICRMARLN